jgi:predicted ATPase
MNESLKIKDFGAIKEAKIDIKRFLVLIGTQASGKSTIAKLLSFFRSIEFIDEVSQRKKYLDSYGLGQYFNDSTEIEYTSLQYSVSYKKNTDWKIDFTPAFEKELKEDKIRVRQYFKNLISTNEFYKNRGEEEKNAVAEQIFAINWKDQVKVLKQQIYIPTERILASLISQTGFTSRTLAIPRLLQDFGSKFEIEKNYGKEYHIDSLGISFKFDEGKNKVFYNKNDKSKFVLLSDSASGFQSAIPLYIVIGGLQENNPHTFIIEEPEANLFPTAQNEIIRYLVSVCNVKFPESELVITTHSPYILSTFNNLLFGYTTRKKHPSKYLEIDSILSESFLINPDDFNAYYLSNGGVTEIFNATTGVIAENVLDDVSEDLAGERDELMDIYDSKA